MKNAAPAKEKKGKSRPVTKKALRVLIVEDNEDDALLIVREFKKGGYNPEFKRVETAAALKNALKEKQWDIIICDYTLPKFNAPYAIAISKETDIDIPLIIVSGTIGEEKAAECMRLGANDYIIKNNLSRLCPAVARELAETDTRSRLKQVESQRRATLEALRKSEEFFKEITENASDIIIITDKNGDIKYCSRSVERFIGYKPEEIIGKNTFMFIHPDDIERAISDYGKAILSTDSAIPNAFRIVHKDGTERYFDGLGKNLLDNPVISGFIMNVRDMTEYKQVASQKEEALEALIKSEEKYRTILEEMEEAYFEVDLAGNFTFVNDAESSHLGYSKEELIGMNNRQYTDEENAKKLYQAFNQIYKTREPCTVFDYEIIKKDGTREVSELFASLIRDKSGKPIGFRGLARQITERKKAETTLRESEEKYRNIIENMQEGYLETDLAGNFTFVNDAECRNLGYSKEELIGMNNRRYQDETTAQNSYQLFSIGLQNRKTS